MLEAGDSVYMLISRCSSRLAGLSLASGQGRGQARDTYSYLLSGPLSRAVVGYLPSAPASLYAPPSTWQPSPPARRPLGSNA